MLILKICYVVVLRLTRARRLSENAFGIYVSQWRIFERLILTDPETTEEIIKGTCVLHNFLRVQRDIGNDEEDISLPRHDGLEDMQPINRTGRKRRTRQEWKIRENFKKYFSTPAGALPWTQQ